MRKYARIVNGQAVDVTTSDPADTFHPDVAAQFVVVPDAVENGDHFDGVTWTTYAAPVSPASVAPQYELLTPMTFYMAFTPAERIKIKTSTDPVVAEFWSTFELSVQLAKPTDPNLTSVSGGLAYLVSVGILEADRIEPVMRGIPQ